MLAEDAEVRLSSSIVLMPDDCLVTFPSEYDRILTMVITSFPSCLILHPQTQLFNPQIAAASGATATALQNGKIKNKVLKLTLEIQGMLFSLSRFGIQTESLALSVALQISQAQGSDETSDIAAETTKLNNNIALDTKAAGQASQAATGTPTK